MITLRNWQRECLDAQMAAIENGNRKFFVAAGVGAGKSTQGLSLYKEGQFDHVVIVTPKSGIRGSWTKDAARMGINLTSVESKSVLLKKFADNDLGDGFVLNTQMVAGVEKELSALCATGRVLTLLDEAHHLGEEMVWAGSIERALGASAFVVGFSGTPYRDDNKRISCLEYEQDGDKGVATPHFSYTYEQSLSDGHVAPITIRVVGGTVGKQYTDGRFEEYKYTDGDYSTVSGSRNLKLMNERLRLSVLHSSDWQLAAVNEGRKTLNEFCSDGRPWGGLIVCATIAQANELADQIESRWGEKVSRIIDAAHTETAVAEFNSDESIRWAVSITKVSEGINIDRLRVCVLLTTVTTRCNFEQIRGRVARLMSGVDQTSQVGVMYAPADPRIIEYAVEAHNLMLHEVPWLDGSVAAGRKLREELLRPISITDLGEFTVFARAELDGAVIGGELVSEEDYKSLRRAASKVINKLTAMRLDAAGLQLILEAA